MFCKLLLRLLLLAKKKDRILSTVADSRDPGVAYILKIEKYDSNWLMKLEQYGKEVFGENFSFDCDEEPPETEKAS